MVEKKAQNVIKMKTKQTNIGIALVLSVLVFFTSDFFMVYSHLFDPGIIEKGYSLTGSFFIFL